MSGKLTSELPEIEFQALFCGVYELSPWVAEQAWHSGIGDNENSEQGLALALKTIVDASGKAQLLDLICKHPDLAGKAAVAGELTAESTDEQSSAGINQCNEEEFAQFTKYNDAYKNKFNFPFIMAVRNSNRHAILAAFKERLENERDVEFECAINEIHKIAGFRIAEIFTNMQ